MTNKVELEGFVGQDGEMKTLPGGASVFNFSIATTDSWKDRNTGEQKKVTEWHRVVCYGKVADEVASFVKKGALVYVRGKLKNRSWTNPSGERRTTTEVQAYEVLQKERHAAGSGWTRQAADLDDTVPF
jgi:single-strand DNA-binding protein